jgi:hypothetical protein
MLIYSCGEDEFVELSIRRRSTASRCVTSFLDLINKYASLVPCTDHRHGAPDPQKNNKPSTTASEFPDETWTRAMAN